MLNNIRYKIVNVCEDKVIISEVYQINYTHFHILSNEQRIIQFSVTNAAGISVEYVIDNETTFLDLLIINGQVMQKNNWKITKLRKNIDSLCEGLE